MTFYTYDNDPAPCEELSIHIEGISTMNPDMCLAFWVAPEDEDEALTLLENADAEWWAEDDVGWCHSEALESALECAGIEYMIEYAEEDLD